LKSPFIAFSSSIVPSSNLSMTPLLSLTNVCMLSLAACTLVKVWLNVFTNVSKFVFLSPLEVSW